MSNKIQQALSAKPFRIVSRDQLTQVRDGAHRILAGLSDYRAALIATEASARKKAEEMVRFARPDDRASMIRSAIQDALSKKRQELAPRLEHLTAERRAAMAVFEASKDFYGSRLTQLDMLTLGDPRRLAYQQTLEKANPASLQNAARHAVASGNAALAAAVISRMQQEPNAQYSVTVNQVVSELAHEELDRVSDLFTGLTQDLDEASRQLREIANPKASATTRIERGLQQRQDAQEGPSEESGTPGLQPGEARIARALRRQQAPSVPVEGEGA